MYRVEKSTAERRVDSQEAKTWKSRVSVTIRRVRSRFGSLRLAVLPAWTADNGGSGGRGLGPPCMELALSVTNLRCSSAEGEMIVKLLKQSLSLFLSWCLLLTAAPGAFAQQADPSTSQPPVQATQSQTPVQAAKQTPEQLQQLVAPIALYPDALVAQVLAASTYPDQIVEADRWLQQQTDLKGEQLGQEVDKQPWDPSVKALTEFPSVLANMDKNLSWTSSLGDAYVNQQQEVMDAVQVMREWFTCLSMTLGWCTERPSGCGRAGIRIQDYFLRGRESRSASALALASLAGSAGAGTTGDLTGITTTFVSTTTTSSPTAEFSLTAAADFMAADFTVAALVSMAQQGHSMDSRPPVLIPAHLAALIMVGLREASPHEGSRASVEVSTEAEASTVVAVVTAAEVTGNSVPYYPRRVMTRRAKS